jgi:hypothetical protein
MNQFDTVEILIVEDNPYDAELTVRLNKYLQIKYANIAKLPICGLDEELHI